MAKQLSTAEDIKGLGTILCVWAHPDDEAFASGGLLAAAVNNGQRVVTVTASRGELGIRDESRWPAYRLGEIREMELADCLRILGITEHHWLGIKDGARWLISKPWSRGWQGWRLKSSPTRS